VLDVIEGGSTYMLTLDPSKNYSGTQFVLTPDGSGGVDVTINVISVTSGQTLTVSSGHVSNSVLVASGGILNILSGGTVISATVNSGRHRARVRHGDRRHAQWRGRGRQPRRRCQRRDRPQRRLAD